MARIPTKLAEAMKLHVTRPMLPDCHATILADIADEVRNLSQPCQYGHWDCAKQYLGACSSEEF